MSRRLVLPAPSEGYNIFLLKTDHLKMLIRMGYNIPQEELDFTIENPNDSMDTKVRYGRFKKYYDRIVMDRAMLDDTYTHPDPNIRPIKVMFTSKDRVKEISQAERRESMEEGSAEPPVKSSAASRIARRTAAQATSVSTASTPATTTSRGKRALSSESTKKYLLVIITKDKVPEDSRPKSYDRMPVRYYTDNQIPFNVQEHTFATRDMRKLSPEETVTFKNQPGVIGKTLPRLLVSDPIAVGNGWTIGDIIQVRRENIFSGSATATLAYLEVSRPPPVDKKNGEA